MSVGLSCLKIEAEKAALKSSKTAWWGIHYREDGLQLLLVDLSVAVLVEQFEVPLQFLVDFSLQHQADGCDVLHKVNVAILQTRSRELKPSARGRSGTSCKIHSSVLIWTFVQLHKTKAEQT